MNHMAVEASNAAVNVNGHDDWEASIEELLKICEGDPRAALRTVLIANEYLHAEVERLQVMISNGYARGKAKGISSSRHESR
jgi:hypothetical protein